MIWIQILFGFQIMIEVLLENYINFQTKSFEMNNLKQSGTLNCSHNQQSSKDDLNINHNGCSNTPILTQIFSPVLVITILIISIVQLHLLDGSLAVTISIDTLQAVLFVVSCILWYQATIIIPTDSIQLKHLDAIQKTQQFNSVGLSFFCHSCQTFTNKNSFHCKKCKRCVEFFDHHCKWLNNCIGAKNYFEFYGLLLSSFALLVVCVSISSYSLSIVNIENPQRIQKIVLVFAILTLVLSIVPIVWLIYLISLHTYLIVMKRTTIQLILENRKKNKIHPVKNLKQVKLMQNNVIFISKLESNPGQGSQQQNQDEQSQNNTNLSLVKSLSFGKGQPQPREVIKQAKTLPPLKQKIAKQLQIRQLRSVVGKKSQSCHQ